MTGRDIPYLTLFSRPGCHLCDEMKAVIDAVAGRAPLRLEIVDIEGQPRLEQLYGEEIPVLLVDGRKVAKFRLSEEELTRKIDGRRASRGGATVPPDPPTGR